MLDKIIAVWPEIVLTLGETATMLMVVLVQLVQVGGNRLARRLDKRI